ncbi:MAG: hypothetical protein IKL52_03120, partial [Candidatus Gastranaerophilales bacterium]|nr:hypothetical protein [Candidatus Gastranaerophilales bacterium]
GATVVGCVLGAKASYGAMKSSSTAAVDDIAKVASKALKNGDDITTGMLKNLDNMDEVAAALDDVTDATKAAEVIKNTGKMKDASALGNLNLDDSLSGMEKVTKTVEAFGKDALSSTKNNGSALLAKTSSSLKTYKEQKTEYSEMKDMYNQHEKVVKKQEAGKTLTPEEQAILDNWDNPNTWNKYSQENIQKLNKLNQEDFYSAELAKAIKSGNKSEISRIRTEYIEAKGPSGFGKLTTNIRNRVRSTETYQYLTQNETTSVIKNIRNINPLKVASNLGADGMKVYNFLKDGNNLPAAIEKFGYTNSMQVVQTLYALGQMDHVV